MTISPIGGIGGAGAARPITAPTGTAPAAKGGDFGSSITRALDELDRLHNTSDKLAAQAATGDLDSVTDYLVAATEAQLATQVTVAVRNKAVEAFNDIMRMQV